MLSCSPIRFAARRDDNFRPGLKHKTEYARVRGNPNVLADAQRRPGAYANQPAQSPHSVVIRIQVAPSQTAVYTLTATGNDGKQATQTVTLTVVPPDSVRIVFFRVDSPTINEGGRTRLCYQVTDATVPVQIVSNFGESFVLGSSCATVAPKQTTIYTLKATGSNSHQEQSLTVTVVPPDTPVIDEFSAPSVVDLGGRFELCYQVRNATSIQIDEQDHTFLLV